MDKSFGFATCDSSAIRSASIGSKSFWSRCSATYKPWLILLTASAALSACGAAADSSHAQVGHPAPNWTEPTANGSTLTLESLRGKPVYLNFFATWCGPCNEEAPYINELQKANAGRGLQIVGVDELETQSKAEQFIEKYKLVYPAIVDDGKLQSQYSVNGLPVHVFIDRSGTIKKIVVGEMNKTEIASALQTIL